MTVADPTPTSRSSEASPAFWHSQELLLLEQVMRLVGKGLLLDRILHEMLHLMSEMLGLNRGRIVLFDEATGIGSIRYSYGLTKQEAERGRYALGEGITGRALAHEQLIIVQNIDQEPAFLARAVERDKLPQEPVSFIAMPVRVEQKTVGVLACHRIRHRNRPISGDVTILRILATLIGQLLELNTRLEQKTRALEQHNDMLARALQTETARYGIIGTSPALLKAIDGLERVSSASASVLLLGESGTGKELFARALHLASPRRDKPFIKVNCAAIPDTLFESELFGNERGAFTGAIEARSGWFEQASTGTIFLDEIGEIPLQMQTKLLRTLQEGTITRLGGKREIKVDVRLVAATNRNLQNEVRQGQFREDLYYRLNVIPIQLPFAGRAAGGHSCAGGAFPEPLECGEPAQCQPHRGCHRVSSRTALARQHPAIVEPDRAHRPAGRQGRAERAGTSSHFLRTAAATSNGTHGTNRSGCITVAHRSVSADCASLSQRRVTFGRRTAAWPSASAAATSPRRHNGSA